MIRILATIGPSSANPSVIKAFSSKTNLFRLNGSHNKLDWHLEAVRLIRETCPDAMILVDVPGIKPRTGNPENIGIKKGQIVSFGVSSNARDKLVVPLTRPLPQIHHHIEHFSINDGQFLFQTTGFSDGLIEGKSLSDFVLKPRKGLNIPNSVYDNEAQLSVYENFIESISDLDVDALGLSFVQSCELIKRIKKIKPKLAMIAKIENSEGLKNCTEVISAADAVMIDRGDLAAEIGMSELFGSIETIARETKWAGKPLIMATENLETMMTRQLPSKSEVMSIAHSISIGADCIMLSEETAISDNGVAIVTWLDDHLKKLPDTVRYRNKLPREKKFPEIWQMLSAIDDMPVLIMSKSGHAIFDYLAIKPNACFAVVSDNPKISNVLKLLANETKFLESKLSNKKPFEVVRSVLQDNKTILFADQDKLLTIHVSEYVKSPRANCITVFHKDDF